MNLKEEYNNFVNEKYKNISNSLINSDIETFAIKFVEYLIENKKINKIDKIIHDELKDYEDWLNCPAN